MSFVYINPGYYNFFDAYTDGQNLKDTSIVTTNGGQCFRGGTTTSTYTYIVNLPAAKEYWARFDLNRYNNNNTSGGDNTYIQFADEKNYRMGIEMYSVKDTIYLQKNEGSISNTKTFTYPRDTTTTFTLHVLSDAAAGKIELYCGTALVSSYTGNTYGNNLTSFVIKLGVLYGSSKIYETMANLIVSDEPICASWKIEELTTAVTPGGWTVVADKAGYYQAAAAEQSMTVSPDDAAKADYIAGTKKLIGVQCSCVPGYTDTADITDIHFAADGTDAGTKKLGGAETSTCRSDFVKITDIAKANMTITAKKG